jgi:nitrite reductase (NADH) small subunit
MTVIHEPLVRDPFPELVGGTVAVCRYETLLPERGVAALLPGGDSGHVDSGHVQVAVFRTHGGEVYALSNIDPFSGAAVLSRGIVGDRNGVPIVASPLHKQAFDLRTGVCLDDTAVTVPTYPVRVVAGTVLIGPP